MTYHCAHRNKDKPSKISARMADRKNCRHKWRGKPCRFSYVLGDCEIGVDLAKRGDYTARYNSETGKREIIQRTEGESN